MRTGAKTDPDGHPIKGKDSLVEKGDAVDGATGRWVPRVPPRPAGAMVYSARHCWVPASSRRTDRDRRVLRGDPGVGGFNRKAAELSVLHAFINSWQRYSLGMREEKTSWP